MHNLVVYSLVHNDRELAPWFVRCWRDWWRADRIVVYNHESTDASGPYLRSQGVEVRDYLGEYDELELLDLFNACWKDARSNWVAVVGFDEFLYHLQPGAYLGDMLTRGVEVATVEGYYMVSHTMPQDDGRQLWEQVRTGRRDRLSDKSCLFNPRIDLRFSIGCHQAITGAVKRDDQDKAKLLHYRYLGADRYRRQNATGWARKSARDKAANYGYHMRPEATEADIARLQAAETAVIL